MYCFKCRKNTQSKNAKVLRAKNGRIMLLLKCAVCYHMVMYYHVVRNLSKNKNLVAY